MRACRVVLACILHSGRFTVHMHAHERPGMCRRRARMCRQVLVLFAALSTCDPGNVLDAVKAAKGARLRVSVVGVAAEVHICRVFTKARRCFVHEWP